MRNQTTTRKLALVGIAAVAAFSIAAASAASLGGLESSNLGSGDTVVASCDTDGVTIGYDTEFDPTDARYEVATVTIADIDTACVGQELSVTVHDGTASLEEAATTVAAASETLTLTAGVAAEEITGASVVISG